MTSQIIGSNTLALFLEHDELQKMGLYQQTTEGREMKKLVVETLHNLGFDSDGDMEIEVFDGKQGVLIFAIVELETRVRCLRFDDIEDLIDAVGAMNIHTIRSNTIRSRLSYCMDNYWLEIKGTKEVIEKASTLLSEYGYCSDTDDYCEGVLEEYGTLIEERRAIEKIRDAFYSGLD